ncbi:hypothetical protein [Flavobacterium fluviatile]|uniref:hypothetical protein n=1 Tax=Flavobacterium fluviatile TaxID=1862387 RepID=UPI0013D3323F|nr:hypothetical protein [Flavobacterium fluviatile]
MPLKNYKPLLYLFFIIFFTYIIHKVAFYFLKVNDSNFHYSLEILYLIFSVFATILLVVLLKLEKDKFDSIGMFFMLGTFIQMFLSYLILKPILSDKIHNVSVEKTNFFVTFILFLLFETLLTVGLLNKKL